MTTASFSEARRLLTGWTSHHERRILLWLAQRLPVRIHADHLTTIAALAMLGAAAAYAAVPWWRARTTRR